MNKIIRFTVSLPEPLLNELDIIIKDTGQSSRSEFIRDLIREKIVNDEWGRGYDEVIGVLTLIYAHNQNSLIQKIFTLQNHTNLIILSRNSVQLDDNSTCETIMLKGMVNDIIELSQKISGLKGVRFAKLTKAAIPQSY